MRPGGELGHFHLTGTWLSKEREQDDGISDGMAWLHCSSQSVATNDVIRWSSERSTLQPKRGHFCAICRIFDGQKDSGFRIETIRIAE